MLPVFGADGADDGCGCGAVGGRRHPPGGGGPRRHVLARRRAAEHRHRPGLPCDGAIHYDHGKRSDHDPDRPCVEHSVRNERRRHHLLPENRGRQPSAQGERFLDCQALWHQLRPPLDLRQDPFRDQPVLQQALASRSVHRHVRPTRRGTARGAPAASGQVQRRHRHHPDPRHKAKDSARDRAQLSEPQRGENQASCCAAASAPRRKGGGDKEDHSAGRSAEGRRSVQGERREGGRGRNHRTAARDKRFDHPAAEGNQGEGGRRAESDDPDADGSRPSQVPSPGRGKRRSGALGDANEAQAARGVDGCDRCKDLRRAPEGRCRRNGVQHRARGRSAQGQADSRVPALGSLPVALQQHENLLRVQHPQHLPRPSGLGVPQHRCKALSFERGSRRCSNSRERKRENKLRAPCQERKEKKRKEGGHFLLEAALRARNLCLAASTAASVVVRCILAGGALGSAAVT